MYYKDAAGQWVPLPPGKTGPAGPAGEQGSIWFTGDGPPPADLPDAKPTDMYLDALTGDVYQLDA